MIMVKKLFFRFWIVQALLLMPAFMSAQEVVDSVDLDPYEGMIIETYYTDDGGTATDTIYLDNCDGDSLRATQHDLKEYDWVDICTGNPKYAIVTKDGKKGIYDMEEHRNLTGIEYRELGYSRDMETEDSTQMSMFYAKKGIKIGILSLSGSSDDIMSIWMDDPDEVYSLDECTTIDKRMTKHVRKLLKVFIKQQQMDNAQIVILDAKSGRLRSWVSLAANMEQKDVGKLLVHSCTASLTKPFHVVMALEDNGISLDSLYQGVSYRQGIKRIDNEIMHQAIFRGYRRDVAERRMKEFSDSQNPATSPLFLAVGYNSLVHNGTMIIPTLKADSVSVVNDNFTATNLANLREILMVNKSESPQLAWLSDKTDWLGYATMENLYAEEDKERDEPIGKQIQFAGVFPVEHPRYTICVVADKYSLDIAPSSFQDVVNPLVKWLLKL